MANQRRPGVRSYRPALLRVASDAGRPPWACDDRGRPAAPLATLGKSDHHAPSPPRSPHKHCHQHQARRLNSWVLALAPTLLHAVPTATINLRYERDEDPTAMLATVVGSPLHNISRGDFVVGFFSLPAAVADAATTADSALLLVNYEDAFVEWATVEFRAGSRVSEISASSGQPVAVADDAPDMEGLQLRFEAGGARLFVLSGSV